MSAGVTSILVQPRVLLYPLPDSAHAYTWPIPQGAFLEIQVPVKSSTALTNAALVGRVWMLDGNDSPWLQPQQGVYVFSSQPSILYPSPSTTSIKDTTAHSEAYLYTHGLGGTGYFDLGTDQSYGIIHEPVTIDPGGNAFLAWDYWGPPSLTPDTLYHWRFTFTPTSGSPVYGVDQTFRTLPSGVAVVGSGDRQLYRSCIAYSARHWSAEYFLRLWSPTSHDQSDRCHLDWIKYIHGWSEHGHPIRRRFQSL